MYIHCAWFSFVHRKLIIHTWLDCTLASTLPALACTGILSISTLCSYTQQTANPGTITPNKTRQNNTMQPLLLYSSSTLHNQPPHSFPLTKLPIISRPVITVVRHNVGKSSVLVRAIRTKLATSSLSLPLSLTQSPTSAGSTPEHTREQSSRFPSCTALHRPGGDDARCLEGIYMAVSPLATLPCPPMNIHISLVQQTPQGMRNKKTMKKKLTSQPHKPPYPAYTQSALP